MVAHTLASESQFRDWLATTSYSSSWTGDAATIRRLLEQSTREIEAYCGNNGSFGPVTATLDFDEGSGPLFSDRRNYKWDGTYPSKMSMPWLLSVTTATLYSGTDRATSSTLTEDTDYVLTPYSGFPPAFDSPYTGMKYKETGSATNPFNEKGQKVLAIAGSWGWANSKAVDTTINAAITSTTALTFTVASAANLSAGQTILIDTEQLYIESISSTTLTVERGVSGTTAATHVDASDIYIYKYPAAITQCCLDLTRISWTERVGGLQDEISVAGGTISAPQSEKRSILHDIDSYATHSANSGVVF
tara:strand:- start:1226 stop:2140 length:915 start_codon:yes stop_codon:yes gene_type:complete